VRFALKLTDVEKVVRAVEITPLTNAGPGVLGVVAVVGETLPVMELRSKFGLVPRAVRASDHFVIVRTVRGRKALLVDAPIEVIDAAPHPIPEGALPDHARCGVLVLETDLFFIDDLDRFLAGVTPLAREAFSANAPAAPPSAQ